jgi:ATP-dependent DNA helicase RecG
LQTSVLDIPVSELRGVGAKLAARLGELGIHRLEELLFHFPLRYQDRTRVTPISALVDGVDAVVHGEVVLANVVPGRRRSLVVKISDPSGVLTVRLFHFRQAQVAQFRTGVPISLFGQARRSGGAVEMIHPEYRLGERAPATEDTLTPVYPTVEGIGQATWRNMQAQALNALRRSPPADLLPSALAQTMSLAEAIATLHQPPPDSDIGLIRDAAHPAQLRLAREELLAHQLSLRALRAKEQALSAPAMTARSDLVERFLANLPFSPTGAQQRVCDELLQDMTQPVPMLRLVQGDVGSGKTLVAAVAALRSIDAGLQVALMAPTELLAEQHRRNFAQWFEPLGIEVCWLSGRTKGRARQATLQQIADGSAAIVVGTHALFQDEVVFDRLGLVIVDEQHRFGVHQRLSLTEKAGDKEHPHQLVLTATPIPRTLSMLAYADLDCSVIDELPPGRKPINTVLIDNQRRTEVVARVGAACRDGRQAYWVCTLIDESENLNAQAAEATASELAEQLPDIRVGLVHGRLSNAEKDAAMAAFKAGETQLLVATTVIEVGVDVPNASLMIIENPERLGLAQLHQLRGRVGRGSTASHCLLLYQSPLSNNARERLTVMRESNDGFYIAERDLALRGPGELLGTRQTGVASFRVAQLPEHEHLLDEIDPVSTALAEQDTERCNALIQRWTGERQAFARV